MTSLLRAAFSETLQARTLPRVRALVDERGEKTPVLRTDFGKIETELQESERLIEVPTDGGVILEGDRELITHEVTGCLACFIVGENVEGKQISGLIHLTPSSRLAWGNFRNEDENEKFGHSFRQHTAERITAALHAKNVDPGKTLLVLVGNRGSEDKSYYSGYSESELAKKRRDLADLITASGYRAVVAEPLPFVTASLYRSPEEPNTILAVGEDAQTHEVASVTMPIPR